MGQVAKMPLLLQPSTAAADRGGEEVRWPLYWPAVDCLCLLSSSTIKSDLKRRWTRNQQSTSTAARESKKGQQSQQLWEHNNQPKDQLRRQNQQEWGQRGGSKYDSKGNSGKNREHSGNSGGGASHLCLIFFFSGQAHNKS